MGTEMQPLGPDVDSLALRVTHDGLLAHVESAGQLRDIFAAIFPDLGDLQLEQLRGAIKASRISS